jgi:Domain of unknown function (DUF397)
MRSVNPGGPAWRKSSYSAANGDCVQVARLANGRVGVRDSKSVASPTLDVTPAGWQAFVRRVKGSRLDRV